MTPNKGLKLLTLIVIWLILTGIIGFVSYLFFPQWIAAAPLLAIVAAGAALAILDQLGGAYGFIDAIFPKSLPWGYAKLYRRHLIFRHRSFDVKGLTTQGIYTLSLSKVFVNLKIEFEKPHNATSDPINNKKLSSENSYTIWQILKLPETQDSHFVILGPPGSGKTTLLKHMTLLLAGNGSERRQQDAPAKLPVFIFLRDHIPHIVNRHDTENPYSLTDAVTQDFKAHDRELPPAWLKNQLEKGNCLIFLDGLDEVGNDEHRQIVVQWVQRQINARGANKFIITSRPYGYRNNPLNGVTVLEVQPFTQPQIRQFVENWYLANEIMSQQNDDEGVQMEAKRGAEDLLGRLKTAPELMDLAVNPLLLTMIATVHRYRSSLPGRRIELYAEISEVFLGKRAQAKGLILDLTPAQQQSVLQPLAYHMMQVDQREISQEEAEQVITEPLQRVGDQYTPQAFLQTIEQNSGLLLERENKLYSFAHKTFQEYFAALYLRELPDGDDILITHLQEQWWHETFRLYAAMGDATAIVQACLKDESGTVPVLLLAIECLEESRDIAPELRNEVTGLLEHEDQAVRHRAANAHLRRRLRRFESMSPEKEADTTLITHAEYQLFLDEEGFHYKPDHWLDKQFPAGQSMMPVVGMRPSAAEAFCIWLSNQDKNWDYRLPRSDELTKETLAQAIQQETIPLGWWSSCINNHKIIEILPPSPAWFSFSSHVFARDRDIVDRDIIDRINRDFDIMRDLALALHLSRDSALSLPLDNNHAFDIARSRAFDHFNAPDRGHDLSRALDLDCVFLLSRALALSRFLARSLTLALITLDLTHARVFNFINDLIRDLSQARDLALALARDRDLARVLALDLARDLDQTHDYDRPFTRDLVFESDFVRSLAGDLAVDSDFVRGLATNIAIAREIAHEINLDLSSQNPRAHARVIPGRHSFTFAYRGSIFSKTFLKARLKELSWIQRRSNEIQLWQKDMQRLADDYHDVAISLFILEMRQEGKLPAFEGIRLVRERKQTEESSDSP